MPKELSVGADCLGNPMGFCSSPPKFTNFSLSKEGSGGKLSPHDLVDLKPHSRYARWLSGGNPYERSPNLACLEPNSCAGAGWHAASATARGVVWNLEDHRGQVQVQPRGRT